MAMNLYEQQKHNTRNTWVIVVMFILFFMALGMGFDYFYFGYSPWSSPLENDGAGKPLGDFSFPIATVLALLVGCGQAAFGLYMGDKAVLSASGATPVDSGTKDPELRQLVNVVEEMKIASGLPMPRVYVMPDSDPNAFATGRDPEHASIAVTRGLLKKRTGRNSRE